MQLEVGSIVEGKVSGITKFGAFVSLEGGKSGLVHISEIANSYVNDVNDHVSEGELVKVKIISIGNDGKINLSIKRAQDAPRGAPPMRKHVHAAKPAAEEASFEDKLKQFMQDSDSRMSGNKLYADRRTGYRRRRD